MVNLKERKCTSRYGSTVGKCLKKGSPGGKACMQGLSGYLLIGAWKPENYTEEPSVK